MSKFITKFETAAQYEAAKDSLFKPNVSLVKDNAEVHYAPFIKVSGVSLNKSELSLAPNATETLVATVLPNDASNKAVTWSSSNQSVAIVSSNGVVTAIGGGNATITVTTVDGGFTAQCSTTIIDSGGHPFVEIGGIKWATMNVGATSETDYGLYFQWGDTQGYTSSQVGSGSGKKAFGWADYNYWTADTGSGSSGMTKYNSTDGKTVLDTSDDAVQAAWGGSWRMPTTEEYAALGNAVNTAWTANYQGSGVAGLVLTDNTDSSKVLFFPAAGSCSNGGVGSVGSGGLYWSSSVRSSDVQRAYRLYFSSSSVYWQSYNRRYDGFAVRGVLGE